MRYLGGKHHHAPALVRRIRDLSKFDHVVEPFCGGCNVTAEFARRGFTVEASDAHKALISMWDAAVDGWLPNITKLTPEQWEAAKSLPDTDPMKAFIGFACSLLAVYFRGPQYKRSAGMKTDKVQYEVRALARFVRSFADLVSFQHRSFFDIKPRGGVILYCDPPYADVEGYKGTNEGVFDTKAFWDRCIDWYNAGADVFVSEYKAPPDIFPVLEQRRRVTVGTIKKGRQNRIEFLYSLDPDAKLLNKGPRAQAWIERDA